ncbi:AIP3-domain-containing protein [Lentinus tigrinus ALCF2SS1-7]|uniref:AIP3-domain-containing protein n=1 Tax=Lentinus tigrinus ALCF2SS1-6 TaxID=1328759 RepID=A0A5C2RRK0_9APHY|nr:AIP3-domain-containing protein [Lentinus tigrinus ALCF2SS1-6]RPD73843.1 AIP3-domain-containing protein [Lentinus tigrinus ALCF2SS1-7]
MATRQVSHPSRRTNQSVSSTASSSRSERGASTRPQASPAVESAVTRLLVSIKVLLESLTQWSKQVVDENHVSDVYVRLGNDFNAAVAAFGAFGIDMSELSNVPEDLRSVLEACLSEDATPENLEIFLPEVRKIITNLLQGLRGKQSIYRRIVSDQKRSDGGSDRDSRSSRVDRAREDIITRQPSRGPTPSNDIPPRSKTPSSRRKPSNSENVLAPPPPEPFVGGFAAPGTVPDPDAAKPSRSSTPIQARPSLGQSNSFPTPRAYSTSSADPNFPRDPRNQPNGVGTPPPDQPLPPPPSSQPPVPSHVKRFSLVDAPVPPPPAVIVNDGAAPSPSPEGPGTPNSPPVENVPLEQAPPAVQNSLAALKKAEALERRASKRFSTYNISKMTGGTVRDRSGQGGGNRRSLLAANGALTPGDLAALAEDSDTASPRKKGTRSQRNRGPSPIHEGEEPPPVPPLPSKSPSPQPGATPAEAPEKPPERSSPEVRVSAAESESPSEPGKPFPVFLQVGREVKKVVIEPGLSLSSLRMLFVDRFAYSPGQDNFPAIYIRDPSSGVQYELEDVDEVKEKVLLSLNIEPLDQIKQHIDSQISSLQQDIKDLRTAVVSNRRTSTILTQPMAESTPVAPRPSEQRFRDAARRISKLLPDQGTPTRGRSQSPTPAPPEPLQMQMTGTTLLPQMTGASMVSEYTTRVVSDLKTQFDEVQNLRRDLGIMRQLYTEFMKQTKESLGTLRAQTQTVRQLSTAKVGGARAYIDTGKTKLDTRSSNVLTRMEELQDTVENIKDDVLKRNVSPKAFLLKQVKGDIDAVAAELESLKDHIQTIKPMWKKTWEEELQNIVEEQQFLQHQEEFLEDLFEDHKAVIEVFGHVEKVISLRGSSSKRRAPTFKPAPIDEAHGGISTVMMEIRSAAIDPERRLKAIAANEKSREKELASRSDEFQTELSGFVAGKKLRMTGGAEEAERMRQRRNELTLKAMFNASGTGSPSLGTGSALPSPVAPQSPAISAAPVPADEDASAADAASEAQAAS